LARSAAGQAATRAWAMLLLSNECRHLRVSSEALKFAVVETANRILEHRIWTSLAVIFHGKEETLIAKGKQSLIVRLVVIHIYSIVSF